MMNYRHSLAALRAVLAWGDAHFEAAQAFCLIDTANAASNKLARKCGFQPLRGVLYKSAPSIVYERDQRR